MIRDWAAVSVTTTASDWMASSSQPRILHVFDHVCNLINERREVLSIVTAEIGKGPFNIVVQDDVLLSKYLDVKSTVTVSANQLTAGTFLIDTTTAEVWNPCPDWNALHSKCDQISAQMEELADLNFQLFKSLPSSLAIADIPASISAAKQLAGLGIGLTPSGDDFIVGALYATRIIHPPAVAYVLANEVADASAPLTTSLSAAWLKSAGRGEAGIVWHDFFDALISSDKIEIQNAKDNILAIGATSGADAWAGFIVTLRSYAEHEKNYVISRIV